MITKLFIFKPSRGWRYCGGCAMATGTEFKEAVEKLQLKLNTEDKNSRHFFLEEGNAYGNYYIWVLDRILEVKDDYIFVDFNYA